MFIPDGLLPNHKPLLLHFSVKECRLVGIKRVQGVWTSRASVDQRRAGAGGDFPTGKHFLHL